MNNNLTTAERKHIGKVKDLPCSVCGASGPSDAHHIDQDCHYCVVALCKTCHQGRLGIHGERTMFKIHKMTEIDALNVTIERLATRVAA